MILSARCAHLSLVAKRIIALLVIPLLLVSFAIALCAPVLYASRSQRAWRAEAATLIAHSKDSERLRTELTEQLSMMQSSGLWSKLYDPAGGGVTENLLHSDVNSLLAQAQTQAQSLTPIAAQESANFAKLGVRVTASMRIDQLQQFIAAAANHTRYLRIERLTIVAPQAQIDNDNSPLAVTAEIYGLQRRVPLASKAAT